MAISGGDGSIILTTKVDTSGVNKGMSSIKGIISKIGGVMAAAFSVSLLTNFGKAAIDLASDLQEVQNVVDTAFGDMSYKIEEFSKTAIEKFGLSELAAKQWASTMMAMGSGMGQSMEIGSDMAVELTGRLADVMSFYNKTEEEAFTLGKAIYSGETEPLKSIGIIMTENNLALFAMSKGYKQAYKDMDAANKLLIRQQFFLEQTSLAAGDYTKTADGWANQTRTLTQRWKEMQATFGETFIALGVLVLPVIEQIINGLNQIALMAKAAAASFGLFKEENKETEKSTNNQVVGSNATAENIEQQTENQKKLNKELKKSLAGFDEINILSSETADNTADAGMGTGTQISGIGGLSGSLDGSSYVEEVDSTLMAIMGIVAEALVAVGLILLFTGHIGWGIGFIIAGAGLLSVTMASASEFGYDGIINMLTTIMGIAGGALLALGIILLWIGGVVGKGVAIGMIIAGGALIVSAVAAKAAFSPDDIKGWLSLILGIAGGALLALGIILVMVGSVPMGIGMIIAGAAALVTTVVLNWSYISDKVKKFFQDNAGLIVGVSLALLVIGIILCFTGVGIPLAIGLISAGAAGLATTVALNWNTIKEKVSSAFNAVINWVKTWGLLVLGIILTLTGNPFLGIPLIALGAKSLTEAQNPTWLAILDKLKEVWGKIKAFWNSYIAPIFTAKWWADLGKKAINGLLGVIESGLNWIINKINEFIGGISGIVGAVGNVIGQDWSIGKIPNVKIPRLAQGAVIPPNREFLAVLGDQKHGTNIEAPLQTIVDAFNIALAQNGGAGSGNTEVVLEIDGREFGRAVVEQGNRENRRIGTRLVIA